VARKKSSPPPVAGVAPIRDAQEDAFLREIMQDLEDDAPRLVYADYLQEKGDPFGEFVRCSVLAAQPKVPAAQRKKHRARADELMARHQWLPPFLDREETTVERGFLTEHTFAFGSKLPPDDVMAGYAADPFFALMGGHVAPGNSFGLFPILARLPRLGLLGALDWSSCVSGGGDPDHPEDPLAAVFTGSPHLAGLREFRLAGCGLQNGAVVALANNPALASLRVLDLGSAHISEVSGNFFGDEGARALAASPHLGELEELSLSDSWMGDAGLAALCASRGLAKLKKLDLEGVSLSDAGYRALADSPFAARLRDLHVGKGYYQDQNFPTDAGALALAASPFLGGIERLQIDLWRLTAETRRALRDRFGDRVTVPD
jgi:uncharacterized protein (TIGR02996 family)